MTSSQPILRHVVLFGFNETSDKSDVDQIVASFCALKGKISLVQALEWGTNVSPEKLDQGYTHCFIIDFVSEADRDAYIVHPDHQAFVAGLQPHLAQACVIDYWVQRV